tara:strand:- start:2690 stop:2854 length:165 start_codon:yes stop_codon:yes gene_type:complete
MIKTITGIFGLIIISSVLFGFDISTYIQSLNNVYGLTLLILWIALLDQEERLND